MSKPKPQPRDCRKKPAKEEQPIVWNAVEQKSLDKIRAEKVLKIAKKQEKEKLNNGYKAVRINAKTIILKKEQNGNSN